MKTETTANSSTYEAAICCRSDDDVNPHQALEAYSSLAMTTDL